jgi:hypothetical protein
MKMVLNSWKEIAEFLEVSVKTAKEYRKKRGLPVTKPRVRPDGKVVSNGRVMATTQNILKWINQRTFWPDD